MRCTGRPRWASSTATAAAKVVFPTPPLPINITRPCLSAAMTSTSAERLGVSKVTCWSSLDDFTRNGFGEQVPQRIHADQIKRLEGYLIVRAML